MRWSRPSSRAFARVRSQHLLRRVYRDDLGTVEMLRQRDRANAGARTQVDYARRAPAPSTASRTQDMTSVQ